MFIYLLFVVVDDLISHAWSITFVRVRYTNSLFLLSEYELNPDEPTVTNVVCVSCTTEAIGSRVRLKSGRSFGYPRADLSA